MLHVYIRVVAALLCVVAGSVADAYALESYGADDDFDIQTVGGGGAPSSMRFRREAADEMQPSVVNVSKLLRMVNEKNRREMKKRGPGGGERTEHFAWVPMTAPSGDGMESDDDGGRRHDHDSGPPTRYIIVPGPSTLAEKGGRHRGHHHRCNATAAAADDDVSSSEKSDRRQRAQPFGFGPFMPQQGFGFNLRWMPPLGGGFMPYNNQFGTFGGGGGSGPWLQPGGMLPQGLPVRGFGGFGRPLMSDRIFNANDRDGQSHRSESSSESRDLSDSRHSSGHHRHGGHHGNRYTELDTAALKALLTDLGAPRNKST